MVNYRQQGRGGKGIITLKVTEKTGPVAAAAVVSEALRADPEGRLFLLTEQAFVQLVPINEIRQTGRNAQGVKIMPPAEGDAISAIRVIGERRTPGQEVTESAIAASEAEAAASGDAEEDEVAGAEAAVDDAIAEESDAEEEDEGNSEDDSEAPRTSRGGKRQAATGQKGQKQARTVSKPAAKEPPSRSPGQRPERRPKK
jgi:DNA gyrase subunit A